MRDYKPISCPNCGSQNVEQTDCRLVRGTLEREFTCHHCKHKWND